jgi:beta-lactamase superfamily II metal-dependent hydrolase
MRKFNRLKSFSLTFDFCPLIYLLLFLTSGFCSAQDLIIHHIDVGQGDCTFIQTPGKTILVDAGNSGKGKSVVIPYLKSLRVSHINYVVASHYHADHIGGLDEVLDAFDVDTVFDRGSLHPVPRSKIYASYVKAIGRIPRVAVEPGTRFTIAPCVALHFVAADGKCEGDDPTQIDEATERSIDENSLSIAFTIAFVDTVSLSTGNSEPRTSFTYFTSGDLTGYDDRDAIDLETSVAGLVGHVDAMKINHHGSHSSTNPTFISTLSPACVFISLGRNNSYGHPAPEVIARLQQHPTIQWIYQTEGKAAISPKQKIVGTSVLRFYAKGDSSYFTVEWKTNGKHRDYYRCGGVKLTAAP